MFSVMSVCFHRWVCCVVDLMGPPKTFKLVELVSPYPTCWQAGAWPLTETYPEIGDANIQCAFFTFYTKLAEMPLLAAKDLTTLKKVTSSGTSPDVRHYYWFRSPVSNQI